MGEAIRVIEKNGKIIAKQISPFPDDTVEQIQVSKKPKKIKLQDSHEKIKSDDQGK